MTRCISRSSGTVASMVFRNLRNSTDRCRRWSWPMTVPDATSSAANNEVVPWHPIVMGSSFRLPWLHGKYRLGAVKCLNLRLFVDTKHQRSLGRIQVKPDHVSYLLDEQRVVRELEGPPSGAVGGQNRQISIGLSPDRFAICRGSVWLPSACSPRHDHCSTFLSETLRRRTGSGLIQQSVIDSKR